MSGLRPYIQIARPDHWIKNVFMIPGVILALFNDPSIDVVTSLPRLAIAILAVCLAASSNYVINEILDTPSDRHHPDKKSRPVASGQVKLALGYAEWILLGVVALAISWTINLPFFLVNLLLLIMGLLYNVRPIRLKDVPYFDVLSESVNNPIRLALGWYAIAPEQVVMLSAVLAYWMLGAFLMAVKRYAEYRHIGSAEVASSYRKSFHHYNDERLMTSIIYYATAFGLFGGIFLIRYHIELILSVPLVAGFIAYYLHLGFQPNSPVQYPEQLYRFRGFVVYTVISFFAVLGLLFFHWPALEGLFQPAIP